MELNFVNNGTGWEAEFEAPSNFNIHLERKETGSIMVSQRGVAQGEYEPAFTLGKYEGKTVFDYDFGALVYPKWIKVVSGSKVVKGEVTLGV